MAFTIDENIPPQVWAAGQAFALQINMEAGSTPAPSGWSATGLPDGVTISAAGLVDGTADVPGVYDVVATATGSGPVTDSVAFQIGITDRMGNGTFLGGAIEVDIDIRTGELSVVNTDPLRAAVVATESIAAEPAVLLAAKRGDTIQLAVGLVKDGELQDVDVTLVTYGAKRFETEPVIALSDGVAHKVGQGPTARWIISVTFDPDDVNTTLSDEEDDAGTEATLLSEIEVVWNWWAPGVDVEVVDPIEVVRTTPTFGLRLARDWVV